MTLGDGVIRTSRTDPIRVDWLDETQAGKVGLTFAPGKHAHSKQGFRWERSLDEDLDRLVRAFGIEVIVCLLEDHELVRYRIPNLVEEATKRGIEVARLPIPDGGVLPWLEPVLELTELVEQRAAEGKNVVIHCMGGLGRAGTVGGCFLVRRGKSAEEALRILRDKRGPRCPETERQRDFIRRFAEYVRVKEQAR